MRVSEHASPREETARRLELASLAITDTAITGVINGVSVTLEGEPPFRHATLAVPLELPISRIVMQPGDLNHPDAVETGDADFDEAMQVVAVEKSSPALAALLADHAIRSALLAFFKRHPHSELKNGALIVRADETLSQAELLDAARLVNALTKNVTRVTAIAREEHAVVPPMEARHRAGNAGRLAGGIIGLIPGVWMVGWVADLSARTMGAGSLALFGLAVSVVLISSRSTPKR